MQLLIVEDDRHIREGLTDALELEGFQVIAVGDGGSALAAYNRNRPDLILLDVMMPGLNGYDLCRQIRRGDAEIPIIMLTAKSEEIDKVLGLELGADDYVTKPFSLRELSARIAARLRPRSRPKSPSADEQPEHFLFSGWQIDGRELRARRDGATVELTRRELDLLRLFATHPGTVLRRELIMKAVWGSNTSYSRTLDQHLVTLRRKLNVAGPPPELETVYGIGYRYNG